MGTAKRVWEPTTEFVGTTSVRRSIRRWEWTKRNGLRVVYLDGIACRSAWRTLREFLSAVKSGREGPVREIAAQ